MFGKAEPRFRWYNMPPNILNIFLGFWAHRRSPRYIDSDTAAVSVSLTAMPLKVRVGLQTSAVHVAASKVSF